MKRQLKRAEGGPAQPSIEEIAQQVAAQLQKGSDPTDIAAYFLQQNMAPEQVVQLLLQAGLPQDQAIQSVESAVQELGGGQSEGDPNMDPNAQPNMDPNGQPMMGDGGPLNKSDLGYRAPLDGSTMDKDKQQGVALFPNRYGDVNWFAQQYNTLRSQMEESYLEDPNRVSVDGSVREKSYDPDQAFAGLDQYVSMRESAKRARELNRLNRKNNLGYQKIQRDAFFNPNGSREPIVASFELGGAFKKEFTKALDQGMTHPDETSEDYGNDTMKLFMEAVRRNFAKSTLMGSNDSNGMYADGGGVKAVNLSDPNDLELFNKITSDMGVSKDSYNTDMGLRNQIDEFIFKNRKPVSSPTGNASLPIKPVSSPNDNVNQPYYNPSNNQPIQFGGYQDPRVMVPSLNPFGRLLNSAMNPNQMRLVGIDNPENYNLQAILSGADPNYALGNVETFRKGLFRKAIRYNIINKDTPADQLNYPSSGSSSEPMTEYKGQRYPESEAERMYRADMVMDALSGKSGTAVPTTTPSVPTNSGNSAVQDFQNALEGLRTVGSMPRKAEDGIDMTYRTQFNSADVADFLKNGVDKFNQVMSLASQNSPERRNAFYSTANVQPNSMSSMSRGLYDQEGNFIPDSLNNQVLNPTMAYGNGSQTQFMRNGGNVMDQMIYNELMKASGGSVNFTEDELAILKKAGYTIK